MQKQTRPFKFINLYITAFLILLSLTPLYSNLNKENKDYNVLLITIDTLRADRLSCYGSDQVNTPNIDSLTQEGILFLNAFAPTPMTLPSHTSILLGLTPLYHGVHDNYNFDVNSEFITMAEHLKARGYATGAFIAAYPLDSRFGLSQGFDVYDDDYKKIASQKFSGERKAEDVVQRAIEWIGQQKSFWFNWLHIFDPHDPYNPPPPFNQNYQHRLYDGEVAYVDFVLGKLFNYLKNSSLFENTIIILTADHGESLGEHGEITHGSLAYNTTLKIPLIFRIPGWKQSKVTQNVSHVDIFPTVCDMLDIPLPPNIQGISLTPTFSGKNIPKRALYFESLYPYYNRGWAPIRGFLLGSEKYIDSPIPELYNLEKDKNETHNLAPDKNLKKQDQILDKIMRLYSYHTKTEPRQKIDRRAMENLKSLGYISGPSVNQKEKFGPEDDVKVLLPYYNNALFALELYNQGEVEKGIKILQKPIDEKKNVDLAYTYLALIYRKTGRLSLALKLLENGLRHIPNSYEILYTYINYLTLSARYDDVINIVNNNNLNQMDHDPEIWNFLGFSYWKKGDFQNALKAYKKATSIDSQHAPIYSSIAGVYSSIYNQTKKTEARNISIKYFNRAIELDPDYAPAYNGLAQIHNQMGNINKAIICWETAIQLNPQYSRSFLDIGLAYFNTDKEKALFFFNKYKQYNYSYLSADEKVRLDLYIKQCHPN